MINFIRQDGIAIIFTHNSNSDEGHARSTDTFGYFNYEGEKLFVNIDPYNGLYTVSEAKTGFKLCPNENADTIENALKICEDFLKTKHEGALPFQIKIVKNRHKVDFEKANEDLSTLALKMLLI